MRTLVLMAVLLVPFLTAQTKPVAVAPARPQSADRLPVKKVVLYKNGVGYFEHTGRVQGSQQLNIDFTTAQLDDVIKSLTVLDLDQGRISAIRYNSIAPLDERLRSLRLSLGEHTNQKDFLQALRGARLEVRSGGITAAGRLLSVESRVSVKNDQRIEITQLSLITDAGEVRSFELTPATGIRIAEGDLREEVSRYLGLIGSSRERDVRRMTISAEGEGDRSLFVSYISEVPVWKSTYRIVLPANPKAKALLQGWAVVDNTVGEDWQNIELSLVAGAPQSFVQHISQPLYTRRPVVGLPEAAQLVPQAHESTMNSVRVDGVAPPPPAIGGALGGVLGVGVGAGRGFGAGGDLAGGNAGVSGTITDRSGAIVPNVRVTLFASEGSRTAITDLSGRYSFNSVPSGNFSLRAEAEGFQPLEYSNIYLAPFDNRTQNLNLSVGSTSETMSVVAESRLVNDQLERVESEATGQEVGDLFEYKLKQRVTIGKNQSALVPIVQTHIDADRVSLWNAERGRALLAIWVNNTSGLSLDSGTFNVLDHGTFAGEGLLKIIRPGEKRLLSYAVDQSVKVDADEDSENEKVSRVRILNGMMTTTFGTRESVTYSIRNNDDSARSVVVEHPARDGWKLVSAEKPEETTSSFHRFRVTVEPHRSAELKVQEFKPQESVFYINNLNSETVALFIKQRSINGAIEEELRKVVEQQKVVSDFETLLRHRQKEIVDISSDQQRLRENMKALKGSAEEKSLLQRYAAQLNSQEDRLDAVRKEMGGLESRRDAAHRELQRIIGAISMDVTL